MKFPLLYSYDPAVAGPTEAEVEQWMTLDAEFTEAGIALHEAGFHPIKDAVVVTVDNGTVVTSKAEAAGSIVAGYYTIEAADLDAAVAYAAKIPTAAYGSVHVRQVVEFEM